MVCPNCGVDNPKEALLCAACGTPLPEAPEAPAPAEAPTSPEARAAPVPPPIFNAPEAPETELPRARWSPLATASMVLGLLGFFTCGVTALFGIVTGAMALSQIRRSNGTLAGSTAAWAGMIASALSFLVVIPMALLYPVYVRARGRAQETICLSNMRQIGAAMQVYATDYGGSLPPMDNWEDVVERQMRRPEKVGCPLSPRGIGYAMNPATAGQRQARLGWEHPEMVLLFDGGRGGRNVVGGRSIAAVRHPDGLTVSLLDGRVRLVPQEQIENLDWTARPLYQPAMK